MYLRPERNLRFAQKLFEHVRNTTTDLAEEVLELDLSLYADPGVAARERERIFESKPIMAAHSSEIAQSGDFITVRLNSSNVIISRQKDGSVAAFLNVCRHRGATVVPTEKGRRNLFTCPYHGWTYSNDGKLRAIGFAETFGEKPCEKRNLVSLPVEERHGFIWIVENPDLSIDVKGHLGSGMDQALGEYEFGKYFFNRGHIFDFPQNWKIMMDGLIDGYHVQFLHGKTISPYFYPNMLSFEILGSHALWGNPRKSIDKIIDQPPGETSLDKYIIIGNLLMPNSVLVLHPHHIEYWTIYQNPQDPTRCRAHLRYLTPEATYDEGGEKILEKNWQIATAAILNEDVPVGNGIQASALMPHTGTICLGRNEVANQLFHRGYAEYMQ
jgi:nitrite reductase/ring-hydroxylating ferredoxin subunit